MNIPDYVSPIIGYRIWQFDGTVLTSLNGEAWPTGHRIEALCGASLMRRLGFEKFFKESELHRHLAPQMNCTCGIYAARSAEQLAGLGFRFYGICGEVNLWGTIIEHSLGWRAQFAYPKSLVLWQHVIPPGVEEAESFLAALTAYGADISLANGKADTRLWTKHSGYYKDGRETLLAVANRPIETTLRVAAFADKEERLKFLLDQIKAAQMAQVVLSKAAPPMSATDPIIHQLREQCVRVVLLDLNSQRLEECLRAIRVTSMAAGNVAILAIGDLHDPKMMVSAMRAGADEYLDRNVLRDIPDALERYFWLISTRGRWARRPAQSGGSMPPPGRGSPPGGSTPPTAPVYAPWRGGPRPMRPREVALAV